MAEVANIINNATPRSLVILDEVGAQHQHARRALAGLCHRRHIHNNIGARTLFATHYHELTQLGRTLPGVRNYRVAVRENGQEISFLYRMVPGASDRSYGIHVPPGRHPAGGDPPPEALLAQFEGEPKGPRRIITPAAGHGGPDAALRTQVTHTVVRILICIIEGFEASGWNTGKTKRGRRLRRVALSRECGVVQYSKRSVRLLLIWRWVVFAMSSASAAGT